MRVGGIHTYLGGFALGVKRLSYVNFLGSIETWRKPVALAEMLGVPIVPAHIAKLDVLISNPPCSRFSGCSMDHYTDEDRSSLATFPDLQQVVQAAKDSGARVVWWESGPLAFTSGHGIIREMEAELAKIWKGTVSTIMLKLDPPFIGLPQRRARTHIIHFNRNVAAFGLPGPNLYQHGIWKFIAARLDPTVPADADPPMTKFSNKGKYDISSPVEFAKHYHSVGGFASTIPKIFSFEDPYFLAIIPGRDFVWLEPDRFWTLNEFAAGMDFPARNYNDMGVSANTVKTYLCKGLLPGVAEWVLDKVITPILDNKVLEGPTPFTGIGSSLLHGARLLPAYNELPREINIRAAINMKEE